MAIVNICKDNGDIMGSSRCVQVPVYRPCVEGAGRPSVNFLGAGADSNLNRVVGQDGAGDGENGDKRYDDRYYDFE